MNVPIEYDIAVIVASDEGSEIHCDRIQLSFAPFGFAVVLVPRALSVIVRLCLEMMNVSQMEAQSNERLTDWGLDYVRSRLHLFM